jgi:AcrR family transcriptional regulator
MRASRGGVNRGIKRRERSRLVRNRVLDAARELFISQGYSTTTTRRIIEMAGVTTGTLYHFFRDKEDILLNIVVDAYHEAIRIAEGAIGERDDTALMYATIYAYEMKAIQRYERVAELYLESYGSWRITEVMLPMNINRNREYFHTYNPRLTNEDYYLKTLALRGMRLAFITERVHAGRVDYRAKCPFLIKCGLEMFGVPRRKVDSSISTALELTSEDSFTVYGFRI